MQRVSQKLLRIQCFAHMVNLVAKKVLELRCFDCLYEQMKQNFQNFYEKTIVKPCTTRWNNLSFTLTFILRKRSAVYLAASDYVRDESMFVMRKDLAIVDVITKEIILLNYWKLKDC